MGLDTYSSKENLNWSGINLCGGMLSGTGAGSFRGKIYAEFIEAVTNESLYQKSIPNEIVEKMANKLAIYVKSNNSNTSKKWCKKEQINWPPTWDEVKSLAQWFKVAAKGRAEVLGWW